MFNLLPKAAVASTSLVALFAIGVYAAPNSIHGRQDTATNNTSLASTSTLSSIATSSAASTPVTSNAITPTSPSTSAMNMPTKFVPCQVLTPPSPAGSSCIGLLSQQTDDYNINTTTFQEYNLDINADCSNLQGNVPYCIAPIRTLPTAVTPAADASKVPQNTIKECAQYAQPKAGDSCVTFGTTWKVTLLGLKLMNPSVGTNCTTLVADMSYCVIPFANATVVDNRFLLQSTTQ